MSEHPRVSIIIPCRNERAHIRGCLASVLATDYPRDRLEVLVADGMSTDGTGGLVAEIAQAHPQVRLLANPGRIVPTALNLALREATGDVILRLDAHNEYPPEYVPRLVGWLVRTGADNVGGAWVTRPGANTVTAKAIAAALTHRFGIGNAQYRLGTSEPREVDTVPFGCYRRDVFSRIGLFDEELVRNQDDELNLRLIRAGGRILLVPDVVSYYYARPTLAALARTYYQYGLFKPLVIRKVGAVMTGRQLAPAALVAGLACACAAALAGPAGRMLLALMAGSYLAADLSAAATLVRRAGWRAAVVSTLVFPVLHFSYGWGFLRGALRIALRRPAPRAETIPLSRG